MRRTVLALLTALGLVSFATPALADPPLTDGVLCYLASVADPTFPGSQVGVLGAGPVTMTEQDGLTPENGALTCSVTSSPSHTGSIVTTTTVGTGAFLGGPTVVSYTPGPNVYLCTAFFDFSHGATYYWDADANNWSLNSGVPCELALGSDWRTAEEMLLDSILCPILALVFRPEGDVTLRAPIGPVWDCPPYGNNATRRPARIAVTVAAQ